MKKQWNVGIFLFNGVDIIDFSGPYEVLSYTAYDKDGLRKLLMGTASMQDRPFVTFTVSETGSMITTNNGMKVQPDYGFHDAPSIDILLIPGAPLIPLKKALESQTALQWIRKQYDQVDLIASICSGAFFLAQAGLLKGKKATTHHAVCDYFEQLFPEVEVQQGVRFVDEGNIVTSGGVTSGINMTLYLVERFLGKENAQTVARTIEFDTKVQC
ncbi:AraC family transcriptional regulator [Polycladomyces abyssicola]|uniref:AraC family transcriptional regulator n=1 Tax=Polycladomyces abyssicola TaxID=1125966 RepID=A0A8D5UIK3_9BACL|nr:DJ-1/PfpI family protein [Polycladomyces abyssicola]BCU82869.1 AraC family transcriptional regulator [Polycladomyces abyssicola]